MTEIKHPRSMFLTHIEEITLVTGAGSFPNPFAGGEVLGVGIAQKGAVASADTYSWVINGNAIDIDSDNGASTDTVTVIVHGRY